MVSVTIRRTAKLEKPMGLGQGRITEGTIEGTFRTFERVAAGSLGLKSISNLQIEPGTPYRAGTPISFHTQALVVNPGSVDNYAHVSARMHINQSIRVGTPRHHSFPVAYRGTPIVLVTPGSPVASDLIGPTGGTPNAYWRVLSIRKGSFQTQGSPTITAYYESKGPGSIKLMYNAVGD